MQEKLLDRRVLIALVIAGLSLLLSLPLLSQWLSYGDLHGLQPNTPAANFTLSDIDNNIISLPILLNKPLLMSFGYRHCGATCPTQLATLQQLSLQLGEQANYLWVSLDPEQDRLLPPLRTTQSFPALIELFPPSATAAAALLSQYRGSAQRRRNTATVDIAHSSYIYLIDTKGIIRTIYQGSHITAAAIASDIGQLQILPDRRSTHEQ